MLYEIKLQDLMSSNDVCVDSLEEGILVSRATDHAVWNNVCKPGAVVGYIAAVAPGVFEVPGFNFDADLRSLDCKVISRYDLRLTADTRNPTSPEEILYFKEFEKQTKEWEDFDMTEPCQFSAYGVCDDYRQVLALFPELQSSERKFVMSITEIRKDKEHSPGGWRWHKWGRYIGTQCPQAEYIADEPTIEKVYVYHVYELQT